jgi:hypothetical protein
MLIIMLTQLNGYGIVIRVPLIKALIAAPLVFNAAPTYFPIKFGMHARTDANDSKNRSPKFTAVK